MEKTTIVEIIGLISLAVGFGLWSIPLALVIVGCLLVIGAELKG